MKFDTEDPSLVCIVVLSFIVVLIGVHNWLVLVGLLLIVVVFYPICSLLFSMFSYMSCDFKNLKAIFRSIRKQIF